MEGSQDLNAQGTAILKELSDIKSNLAVNSTETVNIKASITEIKGDIKEIKMDSISRVEFNEIIGNLKKENDTLKDHVDTLRTRINTWVGALTVITFIAPFIIYHFLK